MPDRNEDADREEGAAKWEEVAHDLELQDLVAWLNQKFGRMARLRFEDKEGHAVIFDGLVAKAEFTAGMDHFSVVLDISASGEPRTVGGPMDFEGGDECTN